MKKTIKPRKLQLPKETVRVLDLPDLQQVEGGGTNTCVNCASCGNRHSTCPV